MDFRYLQVDFVTMLIESKGHLPHASGGGGGGCADESPCDSTFDDVASRIAKAAALAAEQGGDVGADGVVRSWARPRDAALIKAVSDLGAADWGAVATAVNARMAERYASSNTTRNEAAATVGDAEEEMTAAMAQRRWDELAPLLKKELADPTLERDCGHSCGTCPTRSQCHLHEVLDIEDMLVMPAK